MKYAETDSRLFTRLTGIHMAIIAILCLVAYSNTFHVPMHFDDVPDIKDNPVVKSMKYLVNPAEARNLTTETRYRSFRSRYMGFLTYALNYRLHGNRVAGYHAVNLAIHIFSAMLVYMLVILLFRTPQLRDQQGIQVNLAAFFVAAIFGCHPVHTQAVTYISQRVASLATMFYLLALVLYLQWRFHSSTAGKNKRISTWLLYGFSLVSALAAVKTKEIAVMLPVTMLVMEFLFFENRNQGRRFAAIVPFFAVAAIVPATLMVAGNAAGNIIGDVSDITRGATDLSRFQYLISEFRVIVTYIRLMVLPVGQNLDYDFPVYTSFFDPRVLCSFIFLSGIGLFAVIPLRRWKQKRSVMLLVSFGIIWFFLNLALESSVIPLNNVLFEHRLYLPSVGFLLAVIVMLFRAVNCLRKRAPQAETTIFILLSVVLLLLTGLAYSRNRVWRSGISLWEDVVSKSPDNGRGHGNLGIYYHKDGRISDALSELKTAISLMPDNGNIHAGLGHVYLDTGRIPLAIKHFKTAVELVTWYGPFYNNLGSAYQAAGNIPEAEKQYRLALEKNPALAGPYSNLGNIYLGQGQLEKAETCYRKAIKLEPAKPEPFINLGIVLKTQGHIDEAISHYEHAAHLAPKLAQPYYNMGNAWLEKGNVDRAIECFLQAVKRAPDYHDAHNNLSILYRRRGLLKKADHHARLAQRHP